MVSWGTVSPYLEPRTPSSLFFPMDPMDPSQSSWSMDPCSQGVADLSSRRGCSTLAGMAKQAPLPKQRHYRNPARKSGKQIERCVIATFRVAESMGFKGEFRRKEMTLRRLELKAEMIKSHE